MSKAFILSALLVSLGAPALVACGSQVDSNHQGDVLATLAGSVRNTRVQAVGDAEVAAVWVNSSGSPDLVVAETVEVEGSFPAQFTLSLFEPPPASALNHTPDGGQFGVAYIIAGKAGTDYASEESVQAGLLGMEENHLLVYLPADVTPGSELSYFLRGTPSAGFHIYDVGRHTEAEQQARATCIAGLGEDPAISEIFTQCGGFDNFDDFLPSASDLQAPLDIELVDDPSTIQAPNWT